jgi:hypothetical protein
MRGWRALDPLLHPLVRIPEEKLKKSVGPTAYRRTRGQSITQPKHNCKKIVCSAFQKFAIFIISTHSAHAEVIVLFLFARQF